MAEITQIKNSQLKNRNLRASNLVRETKLLNIARLAKMLVDLFGLDEQFRKVGNREGQEIELYLPSLEGYFTFVLTSDRQKFDVQLGRAKNAVAQVKVKVKEENILKVLSKIIRSKDNIWGLLKVAKLYLTGKVKINGSYFAALTLVRCLMIGKNKVYKDEF